MYAHPFNTVADICTSRDSTVKCFLILIVLEFTRKKYTCNFCYNQIKLWWEVNLLSFIVIFVFSWNKPPNGWKTETTEIIETNLLLKDELLQVLYTKKACQLEYPCPAHFQLFYIVGFNFNAMKLTCKPILLSLLSSFPVLVLQCLNYAYCAKLIIQLRHSVHIPDSLGLQVPICVHHQ